MPKLGKVGGVPGNLLGMLGDLMVKLQHGGITPDELTLFTQRRNPFPQLGTPDLIALFEESPAWQQAKAMMGINFFGVSDGAQYFKALWTADQLIALHRVPYPPELLEACCDSHILVAGFPLMLPQILAHLPDDTAWVGSKALGRIRNFHWFDDQVFMTTKMPVRWHLIRKDEAPGSLNIRWREQIRLLNQDEEEVPLACTLAYAAVGHFLRTTGILFNGIELRCADLTDPYDQQQIVFSNTGRYVTVIRRPNLDKGPSIGLAVARKPPK